MQSTEHDSPVSTRPWFVQGPSGPVLLLNMEIPFCMSVCGSHVYLFAGPGGALLLVQSAVWLHGIPITNRSKEPSAAVASCGFV